MFLFSILDLFNVRFSIFLAVVNLAKANFYPFPTIPSHGSLEKRSIRKMYFGLDFPVIPSNGMHDFV